MIAPDADRLLNALGATWPAKATQRHHGWALRDGAGGGKRVSAATAMTEDADIDLAETMMHARGQAPLFMIRPQDTTLDQHLAQRGYILRDPTRIYLAPIARIAAEPPPITLFPVWPPLAIMRDIWAQAGLGPARVDVMQRADDPKAGFIARFDDRAAGAAFCAIHERIAMLHAVEVLPEMRRKGAGLTILRGAAHWAQEQADWVALAVTKANHAARAMYERAGMTEITGYHYRERGAT